ncbi:MAG: hypothetical protein ABIK32_06100 [Chloroflexota bacterium]
MTHTLHRRGSAESLSQDYVMMMLQAVGYNEEGHIPKCQEFLRIALRHNAVNLGSVSMGGMIDKAEEVIANASKVGHAVFDNQEDVTAVLKELKEADLGLSIIVSGIYEKVDECLEKAGLKHHTGNFSLGIWGRTGKLPSDDILEVITMCGHALIAPDLVKEMVREIKAGTKTPEDAARLLAPQCACGVFNTKRAANLMKAMADK